MALRRRGSLQGVQGAPVALSNTLKRVLTQPETVSRRSSSSGISSLMSNTHWGSPEPPATSIFLPRNKDSLVALSTMKREM